jgi:hypothetical protein
MKTMRIRSGLELERQASGDIAVEVTKASFAPTLPGWAIRPVFDPEARTVRFDALDARGQPVTAVTAPATGKRSGKREQAVLDAYRERGPCTAGVVAERLGISEDDAGRAVRALKKAGDLVEAGKVPPAGGRGRPAVRYALPGQVPAPDAAVVDQAEAILREAREG